jgi:hypothetical protein
LGFQLVAASAPHLLAALDQTSPGQEYGPYGLLRRFKYFQWSDWGRLAFLIVPCGILPAGALLAWRWQDKVARVLTFVTVAYFCFFYFQAYISLHHFVPAMVLPLVVFWRSDLVKTARHRRILLGGVAIAGVLALVLSLPQSAAPDTSGRLIGSMIEDRVGGYDTYDPVAFRRAEVLQHLFPNDWDLRVPDERYGGSPLVWNYYAHRTQGKRQDANYLMQRAGLESPPGMRLVADENDVRLCVRSDSVWEGHLSMRPPSPVGSRLYTIPRWRLFRHPPPPGEGEAINVQAFLKRWGIDLGSLVERLKAGRK